MKSPYKPLPPQIPSGEVPCHIRASTLLSYAIHKEKTDDSLPWIMVVTMDVESLLEFCQNTKTCWGAIDKMSKELKLLQQASQA